MYKLVKQRNERDAKSVFRIQDGAFIPFDSSNTDYQAYLEWLEEGNKPEPADTQGAE